jgi:hypothetical protein
MNANYQERMDEPTNILLPNVPTPGTGGQNLGSLKHRALELAEEEADTIDDGLKLP